MPTLEKLEKLPDVEEIKRLYQQANGTPIDGVSLKLVWRLPDGGLQRLLGGLQNAKSPEEANKILRLVLVDYDKYVRGH